MFILGLIGLILAGLFVAAVLYLKFEEWQRKIEEKKQHAKKVVSAELSALAKDCTNRVSSADLRRLASEGYTHVMAGIDNNDNIVGDVELIKDKEHDAKVHRAHNRTGEGIIVIED